MCLTMCLNMDVESVLRIQSELQARIARAEENLRKAGASNNKITVGIVESRLQSLDANWKKFEANDDMLRTTYWKSVSEHDYFRKDLYGIVEETYLVQRGSFVDLLDNLLKRSSEDSALATPPPTERQSCRSLPHIQLPIFSGAYEEWPSFRDLFQSLVNKDTSLSNVDKLLYLKTSLRGEPGLLVRNWPMTDENFARAWSTLTDRFENKRQLVRSCLAAFTALPHMKTESTHDLKRIFHGMINTVGTLESIDRPISNCTDLFVHLIVEMLDSQSRQDWETSISETSDPPTYENLKTFLKTRIRTLEELHFDGSKVESQSMRKPYIPLLNKNKAQLRRNASVKLRKARKNNQLSKRCNLNTKQELLDLSNKAALLPTSTLSMDEIVSHINSSDETLQLLAIQTCKQLLSRKKNPPINDMIESGIVQRCINLLDNDHDFPLQFEIAGVLTNVASGTSEQIENIIKHGAVPKLIKLLKSASSVVVKQAVWALGNIAGDGSYARDHVLRHDALPLLIDLIKPDISMIFMRNIVWTLSNLCRNNNSPPPFELISPVLPVFNRLLSYTDPDVLADTCWALTYLTDKSDDKIQAVLETGIIAKLVELLTSKKGTILIPALRTVGNIVIGDDAQTDAVIFAGGLSHLGALLRHHCTCIVKEAAWTINNIMAGNTNQIKNVINAGLLPPLIDVLQFGNRTAQREASWAITNLTSRGTIQHLTQLVEAGVLPSFCNLLEAKNWNVIITVLDGLTNILYAAEEIGKVESLVITIKEAGGLDKIIALLCHQSDQVYKKSVAIIKAFFS